MEEVTLTVSGLNVYPLKSARGISLQTAEIRRFGIQYDRQWMVVSIGDDGNATFVAQRSAGGHGVGIKSMCLIGTEIGTHSLVLSAPGMGELYVPFKGDTRQPIWVTVWEDGGCVFDQGEDAARWLTEYLSRERPGKYRLVWMRDDLIEQHPDSPHGRKDKLDRAEMAFADGYPLLVVSEGSLLDFNGRHEHDPLPMNRFRPNIVLSGCKPYGEDHMDHIRIAGLDFLGGKLCARCEMIEIDQTTGIRTKGPLKVLQGYRKDLDGNGVFFARNFSHIGTGTISVGDAVHIIG